MKKLLILIACLCFATNIFAQYPTKLNDHATIDFSGTVDIKKDDGRTYFFAPLDDEGKRVEVAHVLSLKKLYADTTFFKDKYNNSMISALLLHNLPNKMEGMKLISRKKIVSPVFHGVDLTYKVEGKSVDLPYNYLFLRGVLDGHELYYLYVFLFDTNTESIKIKNHFMNSLKLN